MRNHIDPDDTNKNSVTLDTVCTRRVLSFLYIDRFDTESHRKFNSQHNDSQINF